MKHLLRNAFMLKALLLVSMIVGAVSGAWAEDVTDILNRDLTGVTGSSYTSWSGKKGSSSSAVYAGQSAGGNSSIQLRSNNNNSGVVTTTSGGKAKSITVEWQSSTADGRTLNVYGSNSAYSDPTELYKADTQGDLLGTIVKGTSTSLTIEGDYEYIGFRSASGAMYLTSVEIVWTTGGDTPPVEKEDCDLALTGAPIALTFDMYNNSKAQYISYTTSSTGEITAESNDAVSCYADPEKKTISVTPFASTNGKPLVITLNQAADENYKAGSVTFTVTVTDATPIATHKAVFSVNGATTEQEFEEGAAIEFPATPDNIYGKAFVGWTHFPISGTTDVAPTIYTSATMGDSDVFFYAVYANASGSGSDFVDVLNRELTGVTGTSYSSWSGKTATSEAIYAGQSAGGNEAIQLRSNNNNSGIVTTTSGGKAKKVAITWNSNTADGRTVNVYGSNSAYSAASELYDSSNQGTLLGTIVCGTSTELSITDDYEYVGLCSANGALYLDEVEITWTTGSVSYSDYCTTVSKVATFSYVDYQGQGTKDTGSEYTMIQTDVRISHNKFYGSDTYPNAYFYGYGDAGEGIITITPTGGATITKIEITTTDTEHNGYQVVDEKAGEIIPSVGEVTANNEDKTKATVTTWTGSASEQFTITNTRTIVWSSIKVYYIGGLPKCATPAISGETPFVTYSTVTISCDTEGATIQYSTSTDGVNYTAYQPYTGPFQVSQTTQVKAQATKEGMVPSDEAYKLFTQQGAIPNIGYFISSHATSSFSDPEYLQLEDALVTFKNGTTAYIKDAYRAVMLYNCAGDLEAGDKINGYMKVTGYTVYNGLPEITGFELVEGYTKTSGNEVTPTVMTLAELLGGAESSPYEMYLSEYVKIENATVTSAFDKKNCTIEQGGQTIILRDQNSTATLTSNVNDIVTVTGHVAIYNDTKQIAVYGQDQIVAGEAPADPTITVTPSSLTGLTYMVEDGPSVAQTISVSGTNLTSDIILTMGDKKFEMSLTEDDGYASSLTLTPSDGAVAATTIYVRLRAGLEVNASYSGSIAIASTGADSKSVALSGSVKEFVPDYASLPFAYDGGKADIESTTGLTQNGLGSDYSSSPNLRFDDTGDALVLKINERPGTLTFDIKGNTFSGGTFTVQTSEDGKTYTDLKSYTELGDTKNESLDNLGENVRYIKWIYTEKSKGNVALGNINLAAYVASDTRLNPELSYATTSYEINFGDEFTAPTLTNPYNLKGITYACSKPEAVEVDEETGEISRIRAAGTFTITATFAGDETYKEGSASYTLTVTDKRIATTVSCESIVLDIANIGSLTRLAPVVKDADDNVITYSYDDWPTEMSFEIVADEKGIIGSLDWNTGEITLNAVAGTVTLKALYNHYNVNSTYQPSECTFTITVEDPSKTYYALVAQYDGKYYAINSNSKAIWGATEVDAVNGKVVNGKVDAISWDIYQTKTYATFKNKASKEYLGFKSSGTDLAAATSDQFLQWSIDADNNTWTNQNGQTSGTTRTMLYNGKGFKNYAGSNANQSGYSDYTHAYTFASGYTRDVTAGNWGTFCVDHSIAAADYSGVKFYTIAGKVMKNNEPAYIVLQEANELRAGVAYIFQANEDATKLIAAYSDESIDEPISAEYNNGLAGSFEGQDVEEGMYLLSGGAIVKCGTGCSIAANRAYIDMSNVPVVNGEEAGVKLNIGGGEDGISSLDAASEGAVIYDLSGRRVSKTTKGLYIVNGKKVAVK
jgi:hypothetical protein